MSIALPAAPIMPQDGAFDSALRQALESVMAAHTHVLRNFEAELRTAQLENSRLKERLREAELQSQQSGANAGGPRKAHVVAAQQRHSSITVPIAANRGVEVHDEARENLAEQEKLRRLDEHVEHIVSSLASTASPSTDRRGLEVAGSHASMAGETVRLDQRTSPSVQFGHGPNPGLHANPGLVEEEEELDSPRDVAEGVGIMEANSSRPVHNTIHLKVEAGSPRLDPTAVGQLPAGSSGDNAAQKTAEVPHSPATTVEGASVSSQVFDPDGVEDARQESSPVKPALPPNMDKFLEAFLAQHGWQHLEVVKVDRDHWTVSDVRFRLELTMVDGTGPSILATDGKGPWEPLEEVIRRRRLHKVVRTSSIATTHVFAAMMEEDWESRGDAGGTTVPAEAVAQAPLSLADLARLPKRAPPPAEPKDLSARAARAASPGVGAQSMSASRQGANIGPGRTSAHQPDQWNSSSSAGAHGHYKNGYGAGMSWGQHSGSLPSSTRNLPPSGGAGGGYMAFARRV
mmetsp:Transcript_50277/g.117407  ORF Transcript_50277/g.117407 Transcript_50277/m.117407 type:complete len:516 (-) Transcript_50277:82-1629(-)